MIRAGINAELFKVISSPPEWGMKTDGDDRSPYFLTDHRSLIESFLDATTDSVRLVRASKASRKVLAKYQLDELEDLRSSVQASELLRVIPYSRQTDHSAHTLYLYLLGIYLFFACAPLRAGIAKFLNEKDKSPELVARFLFQWVYASLLHDIGYIFQGRSKNEIRAVDRMFRPSTITRLMGPCSDHLKRAVSRTIRNSAMKPFEPVQNPEDMIGLLRHMPWGKQANFADDIFETFSVYGYGVHKTKAPDAPQITGGILEEYAYGVASGGYDGFSEGTVDHAVASGLFLFRYSTFWYWLAKEHDFEGPFEVFQGKGYPAADIVFSCLATAAHNLIGDQGKQYGPLDFDKNPLIYLGVLCDEIQKWDRFPAGERHLVDLNSFEEHCTDSERITVEGAWDGEKVIFRFKEQKLADKVNDSLKRLSGSDQFVQINPPSANLGT
jgi:hypothetical protein